MISVRWNLVEFHRRVVLHNVVTCHQSRWGPVPEQRPLLGYLTPTKLFENCVLGLPLRTKCVTTHRRGLKPVALRFDSLQKQIHLSSPKRSDRLRGPIQPHIQLLLEIKRPGREADHSLPINAESKYAPHIFHGVQRDTDLSINKSTLTHES